MQATCRSPFAGASAETWTAGERARIIVLQDSKEHRLPSVGNVIDYCGSKSGVLKVRR